MKVNEAFELRLNEYLKKKNLSLYMFCKTSGICRSTIINICKGNTRSPTLGTLYDICDALEISIIEFLDCDLFVRENIF